VTTAGYDVTAFLDLAKNELSFGLNPARFTIATVTQRSNVITGTHLRPPADRCRRLTQWNMDGMCRNRNDFGHFVSPSMTSQSSRKASI
jgi:hypothetical protein